MKYQVIAVLAGAALLLPAGLALAEQGAGLGASADVNAGAQVHMGMADAHANFGGEANTNATTSAKTFERGSATSSMRSMGQRGAFERGEHASSTAHASSSVEHSRWNVVGGIVGFFKWIWGLPASTTVGQIRAQAQASTSASSTSQAQGLGFFARILGFFHL